MFVVVISDPRVGKLYGCALANDGFYIDHPVALAEHCRFMDALDARSEARFRTAASRINGEGRGHGIMHTVMDEAKWLAYAHRRRMRTRSQKQA